MHFDDRLATVLRQSATGETIARIQYRQLLDILGSERGAGDESGFDAAYLRLDELSRRIAPARRAVMLREPGLRLRNPRLVARLAEDQPAVAAAALDSASLLDDEWLDLVPALPLAARGHLSRRHASGSRLAALLDRLGIRDRGLPGPTGVEAQADPAASPASELRLAPSRPMPERAGNPAIISQAPANDVTDAPGESPGDTGIAIRAIVRRIEEFRKARHAAIEEAADDAPRLPLEDPLDPARVLPRAFDFQTDGEGRINWADAEVAPLVVGLSLAQGNPSGSTRSALALLLRRRQSVRGARIVLAGGPAIAGNWRIDAAPQFEAGGGRFTGYLGRMRRIAAPDSGTAAAAPVPEGGDAMRQVLHELRNPVASIQGFAEMTQQGLQGPIPHEYRALAATIASDSARILAAFDEIDRLVKLDAGAMDLEDGDTDLAVMVPAVVSHLEAFTAGRGSGFALVQDEGEHRVAIAAPDAERLVWRLLASLAGVAAPGETLRLRLRHGDTRVRINVELPAALAALDDESLLRAGLAQPQALSAGMFGTGFALRLATCEAKAAGGSLIRKGDRLRLTLPGLTAKGLGHSQQSGTAVHP